MRAIIEPDAAGTARRAAGIVARLLRRKPRCVLGLATGSTPKGTYSELIRMHREEALDFSRVVTFNLGEYVGLGPDHPQSYRHFMQIRDNANYFGHEDRVPRLAVTVGVGTILETGGSGSLGIGGRRPDQA